MTTTTPETKNADTLLTAKAEARINRDKDSGWGYAIAHVLPFVGIYYACTRRTITPMAYSFIGNILMGITIGISAPDFVKSEESDVSLKLLGLLTTPLLVKMGIRTIREDEKYGLPTE